MIASSSSAPKVLLYEGPAAEPFEPGLRAALLTKLLERGIPVQVVRSPVASGLGERSGAAQQILLGKFADRLPPPNFDGDSHSASDVTGLSLDEILALVDAQASGDPPGGRRWKPWFPVIDFSRCTNCMQCLSFCLFDVYGATPDGKIQVQNENNCKTDCPACSRVCPEVAIMFPKYKAGPINGDAISSEDVRREAMKVDISALLGGDIYSLLRDRSAKAKSRFSKERDDERALRERERCLEKLKSTVSGLEIPAEVLASLPTVDQIQLKAEEARQRAQRALAQASQSGGEAAGNANPGQGVRYSSNGNGSD
jgi:NAD-dependent dihydropyrimidine dehydrogenase PreA subunit